MKNTSHNDPKTWIPRDIFAAYCGKKSDRLLSFYDKAVESKNMNRMSLNWLAILIFPAWLGYRRQWSLLIAFLVIFALLPFVERIIGIPIPNSAILAPLLLMGLMANGLLLMTANGLYEKMKRDGIDALGIKKALEAKAAPSVLMAVLSTIGMMTVTTTSTFLAGPHSEDSATMKTLEIEGQNFQIQTKLSDEDVNTLWNDPDIQKWLTE